MKVYNIDNKRELTEYLSSIPVHDAYFKTISYNKPEKKFSIELYNDITDTRIKIVFSQVKFLFSIDSDRWGVNESISSLTLESDFSQFIKIFEQYKIKVTNELYFLFQMFSGNEIYIICKEVYFNM